jgi:hypothetical protein
MFNELTALSTHVAQLQIPSLWAVLELMVSSWAIANNKSKLIAAKHIGKLHGPVKKVLLDLGYTEPLIDRMVYPQLNIMKRPPIMTLCGDFLTAYEFERYLDVVSEFYKIRNGVVHASNVQLAGVEYDKMEMKFQRLLQKILFSMAGIYDNDELFLGPVRDEDLLAR